MPVQRTVRVEGLRELSRAFAVADKTLSKEFRNALRDAAEPVRSDAEALATARIRKIGIPWSRMRVGVTRSFVYVAPKQRGRKTEARHRRPNLKDLLLGRAMEPALELNVLNIERAAEDVLATVGRKWEA